MQSYDTTERTTPEWKRRHALKRLASLKTDRSPVDGRVQAVSDYLLPFNSKFYATKGENAGKNLNYILDSSGIYALRTLQSGLMAGMTSPARPWFTVQTRDRELNKVHAVRVWLDEVAQIILEVFNSSNTYPALHEMYGEIGAFGTACSIVDFDFDKVIHHNPLTFGEYWIAPDAKRRISTMYREFEMSVEQVVEEFGLEACSRTTRNLYADGNYDAPVRIIHAIEPRRNRDTEKADAKNMPWRSCYFEAGGDHDEFLRESGHKRFPVLAPRWDVCGGSVYGSSPGMIVYGDVKQLQHEQLRKAQGIDYQVRPPLAVDSSLQNREIDMLPGGTTFVDAMGPNRGIQSAFESNLRLDYLLDDIRDIRERINKGFYADLFLMLANAGPDTRMTATEVAERHEEKLLMLGPVLNRLRGELLEPLVEIAFERLSEVGALPPPPEELAGHELSVEFVSILAQAQKAIGISGMDRYMGAINLLAPNFPDVKDCVDVDQWNDLYAEMAGVKPQVLTPIENRRMVREARNKAMAAQAQSAMLAEQAKAVNSLGNTPGSGDTALTAVSKGLTGYSTPGAL